MNHLDLFSGIGGFAYAAQQVWEGEHNIVSFVEREPFCQKVLNKHWPDVDIFDDIKEFKYDGQKTVDLLTGGFPCQPYSVAGNQKGSEDDRALWPEMLRVIQESDPTWVIGENVVGIINMELDNFIADLESQGYEVQTVIIPAIGVGARHRRERVWIIAHTTSQGLEMFSERHEINEKHDGITSNTFSSYSSVKGIYGLPDSEHIRRNYGIPNRVDRLKGLGNAIVPQVVMPIMQCIKELMSKPQ